MIDKFDHLTDLERKEWETVYFAIGALQFDIQNSIERFKTEVHQVFEGVRECSES